MLLVERIHCITLGMKRSLMKKIIFDRHNFWSFIIGSININSVFAKWGKHYTELHTGTRSIDETQFYLHHFGNLLLKALLAWAYLIHAAKYRYSLSNKVELLNHIILFLAPPYWADSMWPNLFNTANESEERRIVQHCILFTVLDRNYKLLSQFIRFV